MRALRLLAAAAGLAPAGGAGGAAVLQLLEASGAADGHALAAGSLCSPEPGRGAEVLLVANRTAGTVAVLAGPTPHLNATLYGVIPPGNATQFTALHMTVAELEGGRATLLVASRYLCCTTVLEAFVLEPNCSAATRVAQGKLSAANLVGLSPGRSGSAVAVTTVSDPEDPRRATTVFRITQAGDRLTAKALTLPSALAGHTWAAASSGGELLGPGSESLVLVGTTAAHQHEAVLVRVDPGDTLALNRSVPLTGDSARSRADRTFADRVCAL